MSCFCNHRSVVLYCRTPSMLICHFCEVPVYTLKGRRRVYVVGTVYIICSQPYPNHHNEQIMQIFHPRHPVFMYISSPRQVYSTEKLRSRNRHFSHSTRIRLILPTMCSSSTGKLCKYHPFSPHISGRFATNLRYVECENRVFFDYATLLRFVE